ncbi:hypothetical protein [Solicola gregarius]|uniref:Uncharacterized protein n=1 Tax=Solicola gregarius TaxID=2908642 RepID=A0AA46TFG8_9ACTN|nr:hypothetical protein [Solicola gregarius]UYM03608.1 hypothetical protein L0C25_13720 [Solicola gregarius]
MAVGARRALAGLLLLGLAAPIGPAYADRGGDEIEGQATSGSAAGKIRSGKYTGHIIEDGKPSKKEWLRFRVTKKRKYVTGYASRVWVICYSYPSTYTHLPVKFRAPAAKIKRGKVDRRWKRKFTVDGERYTFKGRLKLNLRKRTVRGQISVDFASCATKLGDPPYFIPLRARHK